MGYEPGQNLALVSHANHRSALPGGYQWSRMEFDPYMVGRLTAQSLVREVESAGDDLVSFTHNAAWRVGTTHRLAKT